MAHFEGLPVPMTPISNFHWRIESPFIYFSDIGNGFQVQIRAGFITDFASIPKIFWPLYPPWNYSYGYAAVVHDYLYSADEHRFSDGSHKTTREIADRIFLEAMQVLGTPRLRSEMLYTAVKWFGQRRWST